MKQKNTLILLVIGTLLISSCFLIRNDCGMRNPKTYNFRILKKNKLKIDSNVIKTNGVYMNFYVDQQGDSIYSFKRFFENGRYFSGGTRKNPPTNEYLNNTCSGSYGHYVLKNDTIIVETHNASAGYVFHYYKVNNSEIKLIGSKHRKFDAKYSPHSEGIKFKFQKVNLYSKSDW